MAAIARQAKGKIEGLQRSESGLWVGVERVQVRPSEPAEAAVVVLAFDLADKSGQPRPPKELENQVATFTSLAQQVLLCNLRSCWLLDRWACLGWQGWGGWVRGRG